MSKVKHTPGPWETINLNVYHNYPTRQKVADCFVKKPFGVYDGGECEANARLIAAAPELLEACKSALALIQISTDYKDMSTAKELMAAIARAEGEEV